MFELNYFTVDVNLRITALNLWFIVILVGLTWLRRFGPDPRSQRRKSGLESLCSSDAKVDGSCPGLPRPVMIVCVYVTW